LAIARQTASDSTLPPALPAITDDAGQMLATLVQRRKFLVRRRQRLLGEAEVVLSNMDLELIERLPSTKAVKTPPQGHPARSTPGPGVGRRG
jgi:hypothetical protein